MVRIKMYNLQTKLAQFKDEKKLKTYLLARTELSLNENTLKGLKCKERLSFWICLKYVLQFKGIQLIKFTDLQKVAKKSGYRLKLIFLYKTVRNILHYLSTVHISRNVQNKIHNLQIRLKQFTDLTKDATKYQLLGISINDNNKSPRT